jgi:hypothetical protein
VTDSSLFLLYNISTRIAQKTSLLRCSAIRTVETCLLSEPLPSNGCCIVPYLEIAAYQRVYMPEYCSWRDWCFAITRASNGIRLLCYRIKTYGLKFLSERLVFCKTFEYHMTICYVLKVLFKTFHRNKLFIRPLDTIQLLILCTKILNMYYYIKICVDNSTVLIFKLSFACLASCYVCH